MIAYVDGKPQRFKLVHGARVWDDPGAMCPEQEVIEPKVNEEGAR